MAGQGETVQCSAVQCSAVQCSAVQCSAVQCSAVQCSAVKCSAVLIVFAGTVPCTSVVEAAVAGRRRTRWRTRGQDSCWVSSGRQGERERG